MQDIAVVNSIFQDVMAMWPCTRVLRAAQAVDPACQRMLQEGKAKLAKGLVIRAAKGDERLILPGVLMESVMQQWHASPLGGHLGARKLLSTLSRHFIMPGSHKIARRITRNCLACCS